MKFIYVSLDDRRLKENTTQRNPEFKETQRNRNSRENGVGVIMHKDRSFNSTFFSLNSWALRELRVNFENKKRKGERKKLQWTYL